MHFNIWFAILLTIIEPLKAFLIEVITILMCWIALFWNKYFGVMIWVYDVIIKIFSHDWNWNFVVIIQVQQFRTGTSYGLGFERTVERICFIGYGQKDEYLQGFCRPSKGLKFLILFMILKIYDLEIPLAIF